MRAGGDPFYRHGDPRAGALRLGDVARELAGRGLRRIGGDVVLDLGAWPDAGPAPGWPRPEGDWTASYALVSGLSMHGGLLSLVVETTKPGQRARVALLPGPTGLSENLRVDTSAESINDVRIGVVDARRQIDVSGRLGARFPSFEREFRHPAPAEHFAAVLAGALANAGIEVAGTVRFERGVAPGIELARTTGPWIDLLVPINTHSVNGVADALFLLLGDVVEGAPTRMAAARAVRRALDHLGVDSTGLVQVDGSGLSRDNRVSTVHLSELLLAGLSGDELHRRALLDSLAIAGQSGTLADRMARGPAAGRVRAKTGFIRGASALSGVLTTSAGRELVFSMIVRYPPLDGYNDACWKPMQDDILATFVRWSAADDPH